MGKHYICRRPANIEAQCRVGSQSTRTLEVGETFEMLEGPKTETQEGSSRVRVRCLSDGLEGWYDAGSSLRAWHPKHKSVRPGAVLMSELAESSNVLRPV